MTKKLMSHLNQISLGLTLTLLILFTACNNVAMPVGTGTGADGV